MDNELKRKWVEALRSGQYQQAKGKLRDATGFCCVGVLCDLVDPNGWNETELESDGFSGPTIIFDWYGNEGLAEYEDAQRDIGLDYEDQNDLAGMNDGGRTFSEIADYIESHNFDFSGPIEV